VGSADTQISARNGEKSEGTSPPTSRRDYQQTEVDDEMTWSSRNNMVRREKQKKKRDERERRAVKMRRVKEYDPKDPSPESVSKGLMRCVCFCACGMLMACVAEPS